MVARLPIDNVRGKRVDIVDDSRSFLAGLKSMLTPYDIVVRTFANIQDTLVGMKQDPPDVLVTDIELLDETGFDLIQKIRAESIWDDIPILVLTEKENADYLIQSLELGADAFTSKANLRGTFLPQLHTLLRLRGLFQELRQPRNPGSINAVDTVKSLVSYYKHEFGNAMTVLEGKLRKLERTQPALEKDESMLAVRKSLVRLHEILNMMELVKNCQDESDLSNIKILKKI